MKSKIYKFNKYFYTLIFSIISMSIFVMKFEAYNTFLFRTDTELVKFFIEFEYAFKPFDIVYVTLWIFILYFYLNVYFDGKKYDKKSLLCTIVSILLAIITMVGTSYNIDDTLHSLYSSSMQIFKTIIFSVSYYLVYYALLKKLLNAKINFKNVKKKLLLSQGK